MIAFCLSVSAIMAQPGHDRGYNDNGRRPESRICDVRVMAAVDEEFVLFIDGEQMNRRQSKDVMLDKLRGGKHEVRIELLYPETVVSIESINIKDEYEEYRVSLQGHGPRAKLSLTKIRQNRNRHNNPHWGSPHYNDGRHDDAHHHNGAFDAPHPGQTPAPLPAPRVSPEEMNAIIAQLKSESFDDNRLQLAKEIAKSKPLTADNMARIVETFSFESNSVDFCKFAYQFVVDPENFFVVTNRFKFSSNKDEVLEFMRKHPRM